MAVDLLDLEYNVKTLLPAGTAVPGASQNIKSTPFRHKRGIGKMSLWIKAAGSSPALKVFVEGATADTDTKYTALTPELEVQGALITISDSSPHAVNIPDTWLPLIRVRVTDDAGNGADTTVQIDITENRVDQ